MSPSTTLLQACLATGVILTLGRLHAGWATAGPRLQVGGLLLLGALLVGLAALRWRPGLGERLEAELRAPSLRLALAGGVGLGLALLVPQLTVRLGLLLVVWAMWVRRGAPGWLRLAAWGSLGLAVVVRLAFVVGYPRPLWSQDSASYLAGVHMLLTGGDLVLDPQRTPVLSAYVLAWLGTTRSYLGYLLAAHTLGVLAGIALGRAVARRYGRPAGWLAFAGLALSPRLITYEHWLLSEHVFVLALSALVYLLLRWLRDDPPEGTPEALTATGEALLGVGVGVAAGVAILARPVAMALPPVVILATLARRRRVAPVAAVVLGLAAPLLLTASFNAVTHGFFGLTKIGSYALFGAGGHLVDPSSPGHEAIKQEMRGPLAAHNARRPFWHPDFNWLVYAPEGPLNVPALRRLSEEERGRVVGQIARQAVLGSPLRFLLRASYEGAVYVVQPHRHYLIPYSHLPPLDPLRADDRSLGTPAARGLFWQGDPGAAQRAIYTGGAHGLTRVYSLLPFELLEHPLFALVVLVAAWRRRRDRVLLATLALCALALMTTVCVMNAVLPRYHLQAVPFLTLAAALLAAGWWERAQPGGSQPEPEAS